MNMKLVPHFKKIDIEFIEPSDIEFQPSKNTR